MSINAFFFAEGQQLEEEEKGGQAVNETVRQTRRPERSSSHYLMLSEVRLCVWKELHSARRKDPTTT